MKILLKIFCAPMIAVLSVFVWLTAKLVQVSAVVLNFIAIAVGLGALCILFDGKTAQGICGLIAAFFFTPFGLPLISIMLLGQVQKFRYWIQNSVYGLSPSWRKVNYTDEGFCFCRQEPFYFEKGGESVWQQHALSPCIRTKEKPSDNVCQTDWTTEKIRIRPRRDS